VLYMLEPLVAAHAMPLFQADYELVVRGWDFRDWISTRNLTDDRALTGILRALTDDPQSMQVRVVVPRPCSFVSLGFLDGGTYRALRERREPDLERFLSRTPLTRIRWADVMWVGPLAWLDELVDLVRAEAHAGSGPVLEHLALLRAEAEARGHEVAISGWYGP